MKLKRVLIGLICIQLCLSGCISQNTAVGSDFEHFDTRQEESETAYIQKDEEMMEGPFDKATLIDKVKNDPVFEDYGRLLFPVNDLYMDGDTLEELRLTWYNNIDPEETVEIVNTLWQRANNGETIFYDIYSDEEKAADPARAISFIFEHAEELEVDTDGYSLWGGSAGGRMAAWLGTYGPEAFGGDMLPRP